MSLRTNHLFALATTMSGMCVTLSSTAQAVDPQEDALVRGIDAAATTPAGDIVPDAVINAFFNRQVGRYLSTTGDLTTSRGFAVLDNADDRLSIGGQWTPNSNITGYTPWVVSGAFKANIKKGFSTVFKDGEEQTDLGAALKLTYITKAILRAGRKGAPETAARLKSAQTAIELQNELGKEAARSWAKAERAARGITKEAVDPEAYDEQKEEQVADLARAAAKTIEEKEYYGSSHAFWFSGEAFSPFSPTNYYTVDSVRAATWKTHELRAVEGRLSGTYLYTKKGLGTMFVTAWVGYLSNNNILSKQLTTTTASSNASNTSGDTLALVQLDGKSDVGIGAYAPFETYKVGARGVWMFQPWVGLSGEVEKWTGDYEPLNWKLGIPFALKNEKGERAINFELQWREQLDAHTVGISVGLPFGGPLYK